MKLTDANHAIRARNVTASEVAALMPEGHAFVTATDVYQRLRGESVWREPSEMMHVGSVLEPAIQQLAAERLQLQLRANGRTWEHHRVPLCATPDAFVVGQSAVAEFKATAGAWWGRWSLERGLPPDIEWQVRAQLACTHRQTAYVVCLMGLRVHHWTVERHRGKERALTQAVERFWTDHVLPGIPPGQRPETMTLTA